MKANKARLSQARATCFEELQDAKAIATLASEACEGDEDDADLATAESKANGEVEKKRHEFESAQEAFDTATLALDTEYLTRQPGSKVAVAILKKRATTAAQEVKRLRNAHIACQKAVERAMQSKKPVAAELFKKLRVEEAAAQDALDKALQEQAAVPAA